MLSGMLLVHQPHAFEPIELDIETSGPGAFRRGLATKRLNSASGNADKRRKLCYFNPLWETMFFSVYNVQDNTVECLVCRQVFSAPKQFNLARHYRNKHERQFRGLVGEDRAQQVARLKALKSKF